MKVLFSTFATNYATTTGMVITQDEITKEKKLRVGTIHPRMGEAESVKHVAEHGSKVPLHVLKKMVEVLEAKEKPQA